MHISGGKPMILSVGEQQGRGKPSHHIAGQGMQEEDSFSFLGSEIGKIAKVEKEISVRLEN